MTDPTGRSFLSYTRSRLNEARFLIAAQHDVGIPTWQDVENLYEEPTEEAIRSVLSDSTIANAVMWLTPEVQQSAMIRRVEAPLILDRCRKQDGFFLVPVAAGRLTYESAAAVVGECIGIEDLRNWNIRKVSSDPISAVEAREIAVRVLQRRIESINSYVPPGEPFKLVLNTRACPSFNPGIALTIDWTHRFNEREATRQTWERYILPALSDVANTVQRKAPGRMLLASGLLSIPAAVSLGFVFMAPRKLEIAWEQSTTGRSPQIWTVNESTEDSGFEKTAIAGQLRADDLAILVSVNADASHALSRSKASLPSFRVFVHIKHKTRKGSVEINSPGQASHLARLVADSAREAREDYQVTGNVHLFLATPVGLAMLIGQLLNTLGQVQTYEHIPEGATGYYSPAALLSP